MLLTTIGISLESKHQYQMSLIAVKMITQTPECI